MSNQLNARKLMDEGTSAVSILKKVMRIIQ